MYNTHFNDQRFKDLIIKNPILHINDKDVTPNKEINANLFNENTR